MTHVLLTGATGHLGSYLVRDLLSQGFVPAIVIRDAQIAAEERFQQLVTDLHLDPNGTLPVFISGDTALPNFGMSPQALDWVRQHCRHLMHSAATVQFNNSPSNEILRANINSAKRAADLFRSCKMEKMVYVSTAYVCGRRSGTIYEGELDLDQPFRNDYENSKMFAEKLLRSSVPEEQLIVVRPAIIVGDSTTGETRQFHSIYRFAQFTSILADAASKDANGQWEHNVRLTVSADKTLNLVAVDWVSAATVEILKQFKHDRFNTFHLTPSEPTRLCEIEAALQHCFNYFGVKFVGNMPELIDRSEREDFFYGYVSSYLDYWRDDPQFDRRHADQYLRDIHEPRIDEEFLKRTFQFAVTKRFGKLKAQRTAS